ncbi:isochorismatase family protein [Streptomyces iconiensis]|uniref:Isochorismatase family protein n=1 Tax=Streptomyces iconiensis TaxID=1384038 RepID=A0ABT6ZUP3_9ACTN|nr:isochorismatase family protein [Streptomyces iconiensis]MDJ1132781.1 isochorismatase family protein [Streptomyces iconiensis]
MAVTTLDPHSALVLIDLQKGITAMPSAHPMQEVVDRSARLATAFRLRRLPVVLVNVKGGAPGRTEVSLGGGADRPADWAELRPELDVQGTDILITKQQWGAFYGTALDLELRRRGVTQIVLGGVATSFGVESTARAAYDRGYHVTVVSDAVTGPDAGTHRHSLEDVFPLLGETGTTEEVLALLGP